MLEVSDLSKSYPDTEVKILARVSFSVGVGVTAIMGASGSGKTTLFRCLAGITKLDEGSIQLAGRTISWSDKSAGDPRVGSIFQDYRLIDFLTVGENISLARELRALPINKDTTAKFLTMVGLEGYENRSLPTLSGGQQQRVAIARTLATEPQLILADEPTGALDRTNTELISSLLSDVAEHAQIPILIATHDAQVADRTDRTMVFDGRGGLIEMASI